MSAFKDRQQGFEAKYANDQDLLFRIESRAAKLLGLWAAQRMEFPEQEAQDYALSIVSHNQKEPGLNDIITKITHDLTAAGHDASDVRDTLASCLTQAEAQINP